MRTENAHKRVLVVDDDAVWRGSLAQLLRTSHYDVIEAPSGVRALDLMLSRNAPALVLLDWMMPSMDGIDVLRFLRAQALPSYTYVILLTALDSQENVAAGLDAGADDYLTKPFRLQELLARLRVGERMVALEETLRKRVAQLEAVSAQVRELEGLIPVCMHCRRVRVHENHWERVESYLERRGHGVVSHSLCAQCFKHHYPEA